MQRGGDYLSEYLTSVLDKDAGKAQSVIMLALQERRSLISVFEILTKAQFQIGELWEKNVIGIEDEHFATDLALELVRLVSEKARSFRRGTNGTALLCCVEGEYHSVGLTMFAEVLRNLGVNIRLLGPNQSFPSILDAAKKSETRIDLICLSVTMEFNIPNLTRTLKLIRSEPSLKEVAIMVGGRLSKSFRTEELLGNPANNTKLADFVASSLFEASTYAISLLEAKSSRVNV